MRLHPWSALLGKKVRWDAGATLRSGRIDERVVEDVRVLLVVDDDLHAAGEAGERPRTRIGDHVNRERWRATIHRAGVLQHEGAFASMQSSRHLLYRNVSGRSLHRGARRQHLALARGREVSGEPLLDRHPGEWSGIAGPGRSERNERHFEWAARAVNRSQLRHDSR